MNETNYNENYQAELFAQSQVIHDYCYANDKGSKWAKIMTYVHTKISEKGFLGLLESNNEIFAIKVLLGNSHLTANYSSELQSRFQHLSKVIKESDRELTELTGAEYWLGSDLQNRLKFYEDASFQEEVLFTYYSEIAPIVNLDFALALSA